MPCKQLPECVKYSEMTLDPVAADCNGCPAHEEVDKKDG